MTGLLVCLVAFLPEANLDLYLSEPVPPVECSEDMLDYPPRLLPFDNTMTLRLPLKHATTLDIQPGYLVSECELLRMTNAKIELARLKLDLQTMRELRSREFELWRMMAQEYEYEIAQLSRQSWWRKNKLLVGIVSGVVGTIAVTGLTYSLSR